MPNCDYYGDINDHRIILDYLFSDNSCMVYELGSEYGKNILCFSSAEQILSQFDRTYSNGEKWHSVHLQLFAIGSGAVPKPRRVALNPVMCNGHTFRYAMEGWGLIQLYLEVENGNALRNSHTNHNTMARAKKWEPVTSAGDRVTDWDFSVVNNFSRRLNREIRTLSVGKMRSTSVLPGALGKLDNGVNLVPFQASDFIKK